MTTPAPPPALARPAPSRLRVRSRPGAPVLAAAIILLVLGGLWTRTRVQPLGQYDQSFYLGIADDLLQHGRFTDGFRFGVPGADGVRPPGMRFSPLYPSLLAGAARLDPGFRRNMRCLVAQDGVDTGCGRGAGPVRPLQFAMLAAMFWMLWWCARACTGRPRTGWIALALALLTAPLLLLSVDYLMTETSSLFLFVAATALALRGLERPARRAAWLFASGVALGLAILVRPGFAWLGDACVLTGAGLALARGSRRRWWTFGGFLAGLLLVVAPWIARNALVVGHASLTFGYASHTLVQRLSFDSMDWHEYGMSFVCWLPDGSGMGRWIDGAHACDRFGWTEHPNSFYAIGLGPMLAETLRLSGGWSHHMSYLLHRYLLADPLRQLGWHAMVTLPLAVRGLTVDHYWGLLLAPVCAAATLRALRRGDRRYLLLSLPAWFMLLFNAAVAVNQPRYNLMLVLPFSLAGAMAIEALLARRGRRVIPSGSGRATAPAAAPWRR